MWFVVVFVLERTGDADLAVCPFMENAKPSERRLSRDVNLSICLMFSIVYGSGALGIGKMRRRLSSFEYIFDVVLAEFREVLAHGGVAFQVFQAVKVHEAHVAVT